MFTSKKKLVIGLSTGLSLLVIGCGSRGSALASGSPLHTFADGAAEVEGQGFSFKAPSGWSANKTGDSIKISGPQSGVFAYIVPFLAKSDQGSSDYLNQLPDTQKVLLPDCRIEKVQKTQDSPDEATAKLSFAGDEKGIALCSTYKRSGMLYVIAAPSGQFDSQRKALVGILNSFHYTEDSASSEAVPATPDLQFEKWTDPKEGAFSMEVPKGWEVSGGAFRFATIDVRTEVTLTSPDHMIGIRIGDQHLPPFAEPNALMAQAGMRVGTWYDMGYGVKELIEPYSDGVSFAKAYAGSLGSKGYGDIQYRDQKNRPDIADPIQETWQRYSVGMNNTYSAGEVSVTASRNGEPYRGRYLAGILRSQVNSGPSMWIVQNLNGYMAPADDTATAEAVLKHATETLTPNPDWVRTQQGTTMHTSEIIAETNTQISKMIDESYWKQSHSRDEIHRKWDNYIRGTTDVKDPVTGETWKVTSGKNYYWHNEGTGEIAGTNTYDRPNTHFEPLLEY